MINSIKIKERTLDFILAIIVIILLNLVSSRAFFRIDLTAQKSFSISQASRETVRNLQEPLAINVFFSNDLPAPYNGVEQYLHDILAEYSAAANKNFSCKFFDMSKESNQKLAQSYGLNQIQIQKVETAEVSARAAWMGLAISYGDNIRILDSIENSSGLEYKITVIISKMITAADTLASMKNLSLTLYSPSELKGMGINGLDDLSTKVRQAADSVNRKYGGAVSFREINVTGAEAENACEQYGLQPLEYTASDGTRKLTALGLLLESGEKFRAIPVKLADLQIFGFAITGTENLDESISASIENIISKTVEIGYITGHGENTLIPMNPYMMRDPNEVDSANFKNVLNDIYTLREINLADEDIPLNIESIVINGPKSEYAENELKKIDQFIMRGGNVMFYLDPLTETDNGPNAPPSYTKPETGLDKLLSAYGIRINADYVMDKKCYSNPNDRKSYNWIPLVHRKAMSKKNEITKNLGGLLFLQNGSIDVTEAESQKDVKVTVLAKSSPESWSQTGNIILYPDYIFPPEDKAEYEAKNLAVLAEGKFTSAFIDSAKEGNTDAKITTDELLTKSVLPSKILVVSSSQVTTGQLIDAEGNEPMALFVRNAADYMNGAEDFCSMRTKSVFRNYLEIRNTKLALAAKLFNQVGLALIVAAAGLAVWHKRNQRRERIRRNYNPEDKRY